MTQDIFILHMKMALIARFKTYSIAFNKKAPGIRGLVIKIKYNLHCDHKGINTLLGSMDLLNILFPFYYLFFNDFKFKW